MKESRIAGLSDSRRYLTITPDLTAQRWSLECWVVIVSKACLWGAIGFAGYALAAAIFS